MFCSQCGHENADSDNYCKNCGHQLSITCLCGVVNISSNTFCSACGERLILTESQRTGIGFLANSVAGLLLLGFFVTLGITLVSVNGSAKNAPVFTQEELDRIAGRTSNVSSQRTTANRTYDSTNTCSRYVDLAFNAGGFISDSVESLNVSAPTGVTISGYSTSSVAASAWSPNCVGGTYRFEYTVREGVYLDGRTTYSGHVTIPDFAASCTIFVGNGFIDTNCQ